MEPRQILIKHWGYSAFRPLQEDIVRSVLEGNDTLGLLPTGGGKSICYQVPGIMRKGMCLVITPLIALMKDQVDGLTKRGIPAKALYSGMHRHDQDVAMNNAVNGSLKFLFVSPERLQSPEFLENFQKMDVGMIAVDEAHCISQWGYDFRPPYLKIAEIRPYHPDAPVLALTATATPAVVDDIQERLEFKKKCVFQKSFERKNLAYIVIFEENKNKKLLEIIQKTPGTGIIYVRSRQKTKNVAQFLRDHGISAEFYHAGLEVTERDKKQDLWMRGAVRVIVATNAFGMGIDKPDVRFVVHLDVPDSPEAYFQEAGRGGRDEKQAYAVLLWEQSDIADLERRLEESYPPLTTIRRVYNALGNYFQIPLHTGNDQSFNFDIQHFLKTYKLSVVETWSAIKLLERDGYMIATEASNQAPKIMFRINHQDLYKFQVEHARLDGFIKSLLRSYTGLFSDFSVINIAVLATNNHIPEEKVLSLLSELEKLQVIWYQPQKEFPQIIYTCERLSEKEIILSKEVYDERKKSAQKRVDAMIHYVTSNNKCRSIMLLEWFGQRNAQRCGECDVCRKRNEININSELFSQIVDYIKIPLKRNSLSLEEICALTPKIRTEKIIKVIQYLLDNEKVELKNGKYKWKE